MLTANRGNELGIRNFELDLTNTPWAKKFLMSIPSKSLFISVFLSLVFSKVFTTVSRVLSIYLSRVLIDPC